jgi:hypothetical protein
MPLDDPQRFRVEIMFRWVEGEACTLAGPRVCGCHITLSPHKHFPHLVSCPSTLSRAAPFRSPGAAFDPTEVTPPKKDHVLPVAPRVPLHPDGERDPPLAVQSCWDLLMAVQLHALLRAGCCL